MAWVAPRGEPAESSRRKPGRAPPRKERFADVGVSPNGLTLATAMLPPGGDRVDVIVRDLIGTGAGNVIANFNGRYDSISMKWLNDATIALALRLHPKPPEESTTREGSAERKPTQMSPTLNRPRQSRTGCN